MSKQTSKIEALESDINAAIVNHTSLNALADLISLAKSTGDEPKIQHKVSYALYRLFTSLFSHRYFGKHDSEAHVQVRTWLVAQLDTFSQLLAQTMHGEESAIRVCQVA